MVKLLDYYRYEKKFLIESFSINELITIIRKNPFLFSPAYNERFVNNIYYDTPNYNSFYDSVNGNTKRQKIRIRWYGDLHGNLLNSNFEIKFKKNDLGYKKIIKLENFQINKKIKKKYLIETINKTINKNKLNLGYIEPKLINRYKRKYYQSYDKKFRITIDTNLEFFKADELITNFLNKYCFEHIILEIKYNFENRKLANIITNHLPFRLTKSSKYVIGISNLKKNFI